ncbi:TIGR04283 family arsenosugar biosynthesis glycosyltransferase [Bosea sp. PAMC 26642]|uniref:TIGR04283 family arsenosugar biosynthesis glycosyltransferase n=1 Tax=Bosea sp. (strain PAMC 26642) TaxID=1792307 RepID=UPI00077026DA|nr:TIGR04283 family arsenosugar biosynthesis glycosyltransferase [Bosea sp. PAMC 26642]AMJ63208.1 glycosyl transferase family 2 [Bosea sp. PAMC 26642]
MAAASVSLVSIVIPTLNAAALLPPALAQFDAARTEGLIAEIIVSDGGSRDDTVALAQAAGAAVLPGPAGRGEQLARGASAARADWLLFLHADTTFDAGWLQAVSTFITREGEDRAAAFAFALDDDAPAARRLERIVAWRSRILALPYGDQGLLISRKLYDEIGGFRPLPLMEDVDLVRRIGRRRLHILDVRAVTSAARYRRDGYRRRSLRNLVCLSLWFAGVPPRLIAKLYG